MPSKPIIAAWPVVMVGGFLLPGAAHFLRGERLRGVIIGTTILLLFTAGVLFGGIRIVEFPPSNGPNLLARLLAQPAFIGQFFAGPIAFIAGYASQHAAANPATAGIMSHSRLYDLSMLYTAIAGALNLMAIIDATARSFAQEPPRDAAKLDPPPNAKGAA